MKPLFHHTQLRKRFCNILLTFLPWLLTYYWESDKNWKTIYADLMFIR
jgi:hypothetical protein